MNRTRRILGAAASMAVLATLGACGDDSSAPVSAPSSAPSSAPASGPSTSTSAAGTSDPSTSTPGGPSIKEAVDIGFASCSTLSTEGTLVQDLLGAPATFETDPFGGCLWEVTDAGDGPEAFAVTVSTTEIAGFVIDSMRGEDASLVKFTPVEGLGDEAFTVSGWSSQGEGGTEGSTLYVLKDGIVTTFSVKGVRDGVTDQLRAIATQALG